MRKIKDSARFSLSWRMYDVEQSAWKKEMNNKQNLELHARKETSWAQTKMPTYFKMILTK